MTDVNSTTSRLKRLLGFFAELRLIAEEVTRADAPSSLLGILVELTVIAQVDPRT